MLSRSQTTDQVPLGQALPLLLQRLALWHKKALGAVLRESAVRLLLLAYQAFTEVMQRSGRPWAMFLRSFLRAVVCACTTSSIVESSVSVGSWKQYMRSICALSPRSRPPSTEIDGNRQEGLARFDALAKCLPLRPRLGPARSSSARCAAAALALALVCCTWGCVGGGNRRERLADDDGRELVIVAVCVAGSWALGAR